MVRIKTLLWLCPPMWPLLLAWNFMCFMAGGVQERGYCRPLLMGTFFWPEAREESTESRVLGRMLALGQYAGQVTMVDETTGMMEWRVQAHRFYDERTQFIAATEIAMSPVNLEFVASVGLTDERWKLWNAETGGLDRVGAAHDGTGTCICWVDDLGHRVFEEECLVVAHTAGLRAVSFAPYGRRMATGGVDRAVILWNPETGEATHRLQGHTGVVSSLSFSADGIWVVSGSFDGSIRVWDARMGVLLRTFANAHANYKVNSVHMSPTNTACLASASTDQLVHLWDVDRGERIWSFEGVLFAVFSPNGRTIATATVDQHSVRLVDVASGVLRLRLVGHAGSVSCVSWSQDDGSNIASCSSGDRTDTSCKVWDSSTGALLKDINVGGAGVMSVAWGRDWERDRQRGMAFAMGQHVRIGERSQVLALEAGVVRMILDRV